MTSNSVINTIQQFSLSVVHAISYKKSSHEEIWRTSELYIHMLRETTYIENSKTLLEILANSSQFELRTNLNP